MPDLLVDALRVLIDAFTRGVRQKLDDARRGSSIAAARAFDAWASRVSGTVMVGVDGEALRAEFARQTAYVHVVRLLLARICEDKGLFQRELPDGGLARWGEDVVAHFYGASRVFDWCCMDEELRRRAIVALDAFDLEHIDADIIGAVYGRYLPEGKHERGRYYTPPPLVHAMLDALGYTGGRIVGRRLGDLACGSGSFLVEACRRLLDRYRGPDGRVPTTSIKTALAEVQRSLFGADKNPFACYLAETNLLIQVLDLVKRAQEEELSLTIERFAIHCADSLLVNDDIEAGFDFLIGNPPYVRADERAPRHVEYRRRVEEQGWFSTRHRKWDLYVPFAEQYRRLLSEDKDARACLVTIESLATAPYAEKLRELLARRSTIHDLFFLEKLGLFSDAKWQDDIVFCFSRGAPAPDHRIDRKIARKQGTDSGLILEPLDSVTQAETSPGRLFNKHPEVTLDLTATVRWDEICYVTKGMVLHSKEDLEDGEALRFGRDDLISDTRDSLHTRRYIGSRDVRRGGLARTRWLEYGSHTRCPSRVSRPTFQELYDRDKIMFGTFTGVAVDDGSTGEHLTTSDSVRLSVRWALLAEVENRALTEARKKLKEEERYDPELSKGFSDWYLCAVALSDPIQRWLGANKRSMKEHVYPEDIKAIPVKHLSPDEQRPFIELEKERHLLWAEITALDEQEAAVRRRLARIEAIGAEVDRLAWRLYRPRSATRRPLG